MDQKDIPVLALAEEYRGEARSLRRGLGVTLLGIVGFGVLYLVPYVKLLGEEGGLLATDEDLATDLAGAEARLESLGRAHDLVQGYSQELEARSEALTEDAKAEVRELNDLLEFLALPPEMQMQEPEFDEPVQMTAQMAQSNQVAPQGSMDFGGPFSDLRKVYELDDEGIAVLLAGNQADPDAWREVTNEVLWNVIGRAKERLRDEAHAAAAALAAALAELDPPIAGDLEGEDFADSVVVPDDEASMPYATPHTLQGKEMIMAAEFERIDVPASAFREQLGLRTSDLQATASRLDSRREDLAARIADISIEKAELEASMEHTAAQLEDFALPLGVLEWNSQRLTRWFPLISGLTLLWFAAACTRLDRRRTAIRAHLEGLPEHDLGLLCGPRAQPLYTLALVGAGGFVVWLQRATGAAGDGLLLALVALTCALAAGVAARPLRGSTP